MQRESPSGEKTLALVKDEQKPEKIENKASRPIEKKRSPYDKIDSEEKQILSKKHYVKKSRPIKQRTNPKYKTPKELNTDRLTYTLLIDSFLFKEFADKLTYDLKRKKYPAYSVSVWGAKRELWHTVRIGRYFDYEIADKKLADFNLKERRSAKIIGLGTLEFFPSIYLKQEKVSKKKQKNNPKLMVKPIKNQDPITKADSKIIG